MLISKNTERQCKWRKKVGDGGIGSLLSQGKDFGRKTAGRCHEVPFVLIILPAL